MAFDINWNKSSAKDIAASISAATSTLQKTAAPAMQQTNSSGQAQLPSWMGNMYSNVPGTDWYSTNPSNQNASKYSADGRPVATVGYDNQQTGQSYHGYATPEQFAQITSGNGANASNIIPGMISSGQLNMPQSSIYNSSGGYAKTAAPAQMVASAKTAAAPDFITPQMYNGGSGVGQTGQTGKTAAPAMPTMNRWNVNASYQDRLARFKSNPTDAQNEILALKQMYDGATGNAARQTEISGWADQVRKAAGIRDSNATFGNNNGETPAQQQANIDLFNKTPAPVQMESSNDGSGQQGQGTGQTGVAHVPGPTVKNDQLIPNEAVTGQTRKTATPNNLYQDLYARTPESIAALAKSRIDAILQGGRTAAQGALTGAKNAFDYSQKTIQGNRALLQFDNSQRGDQYGGSAREDKFRLDRQQGIEDTAANNQYTAQVAQINQKLADLEAAAPGDQQKIIDDLQQIERTTGINVAQLQEQQKNNQFSQMDANRKFDYGVGQDQIKNDIAKSGLTGYYQDSAKVDAVKKQMAVNSAAYASAAPAEQQRLHDENVKLAASIGGADTTGSGDYSFGQGQRTIAGQTLDLNNAKDMAVLTGYMSDGKGGYIKTNAKQQQDLSNAWLESEQLGAVTPNLSALTGIPVGTQTQSAKNQAAQISISARNAANSEASTANSNANAKERIAWDKDPNNPDNKLKESTISKNNAASSKVDPKTSTDNHALIAKDIGSAKDAAEANALIEANKGVLTDADYKDLKKWVIDKF